MAGVLNAFAETIEGLQEAYDSGRMTFEAGRLAAREQPEAADIYALQMQEGVDAMAQAVARFHEADAAAAAQVRKLTGQLADMIPANQPGAPIDSQPAWRNWGAAITDVVMEAVSDTAWLLDFVTPTGAIDRGLEQLGSDSPLPSNHEAAEWARKIAEEAWDPDVLGDTYQEAHDTAVYGSWLVPLAGLGLGAARLGGRAGRDITGEVANAERAPSDARPSIQSSGEQSPPTRAKTGGDRATGNHGLQEVSESTGEVIDYMPNGILLNADSAVIDSRKISGYALNPDHPVGGNKARVFSAATGFTRENADELTRQLAAGLENSPARPGKVDTYGSRFTVDIEVTGPTGNATVRTGWIYDVGSTTPRLATLFIK